MRENHLPGEQPHFEAAEGTAHHHLVCRGCHMVTHLDDALLGTLHEQLQQEFHFYNVKLDLVAAGYCQTCWQAIQLKQKTEHSHSPLESSEAQD